MTHDIRQLSTVFGAEISGVNFAELTATEAKYIVQTWLKYHLILVRNQNLSEIDMIKLGRYFGTVEKARRMSPLASHEEIMVISNIRAEGKELGSLPDGELYWHYDRIHQKIPNKAGVLYGIEIPGQGGETRFVDMCDAYDNLPDSLKKRIEGLTALNTYQYGQTKAENKQSSDENPSAIHPVVRTIPETGRKAIYVCRLMTDKIMDIPEIESNELLNILFEHAENPRFQYEHKWLGNDVIIWDNRCVMHARNDFDKNERRLLKRVTIADSLAPA